MARERWASPARVAVECFAWSVVGPPSCLSHEMTGDSAPTSPSSCASRVPRTGAEVFTMTDPGVHDADPGVHDADLAVHDGPIRAFTMDRFSHWSSPVLAATHGRRCDGRARACGNSRTS